MDTIAVNWAYFKENHPKVYEAYQAYGRTLHMDAGPLDEKTRWLVKVAISTAGQNSYALKTHIRKALLAGLSEAEIEHAILLTASTVGFPTMMEGLLIFREVMDDADEPVITP